MKLRIIADSKIPFLKGRLESVAEVVYAPAAEITRDLVKDADALIVRTRTRCGEELLGGTRIRLVATATIGTDHLDLEWLRDAGIAAANAAGCNAPGVAQYVWSSLLRNGFDTHKDKLGVIGFGNIGSIVADWGRKMGTQVLVCDPPRKDMGLTDEDYLSKETLLRECDAVTLHTPLTFSGAHPTFHLISDRELKMMKPEGILVNASRGAVADNIAWREHLKSGAGKAVIDVWEGEPLIDSFLLGLAEIATPHIAGYSLEGKQRATRMAIEAIENKFGVTANKTGLEGKYSSPGRVTPETIIDSYDPYIDTALLRREPERLDGIRDSYALRREPSF